MKEYVFYKNGEYLKEDGTFTSEVNEAATYKGRFWIELLKILLQLVLAFGVGTLKVKK